MDVKSQPELQTVVVCDDAMPIEIIKRRKQNGIFMLLI